MHNQIATLSKPNNALLFTPYPNIFHALKPSHYFTTRKNSTHHSILNCRGIQVQFPKQRPNSINGSVENEKGKAVVAKEIDVATLGNLCVDIVLSVPKLPPKAFEERKAYMEELSKSPPDKMYWEAGGNCNMAIAAARIGLHVVSIGHVGNEMYGHFLLDVLHQEGINMVEMNEQTDMINSLCNVYETLLCWVLVDPLQRHGFCSHADFSTEPTFGWMSKLSSETKLAIKKSKIIFCNGYGFDELPARLLVDALDYAIQVGTAIFFDPGPRGKTLVNGTSEEKIAINKYLQMSDVLLLTSEEADSLTGIDNPILAGQYLLRKSIRTKWVIIKMGRRGSILITSSSISCAPAFKVDVVDTVGCGDSFVAAIAFGYIQKLPFVHTLTIANAVGAATAMGCGAGRNVASLRRIMELMNEPNLSEDDKFWEDLLKEHVDANEVTLLTKTAINGSNNWLKRLSMQKILCEVLQKLESVQIKPVEAC